MNEVIEVNQAEILTAINRAEVDIQVATAKQYPRDIQAALNRIKTIATLDNSTAEECFYVLRRRGAAGQENTIEGLSVRMAEIIAGAWGNMRVQTRITGNDGKMITVQGMCHDLETNLAVCVEVKRRITDRNGRTFSEDMQVVTGNAASAIAFRNAVLKVVPKAITARVIEEVRNVALGKSINLETSRQNIVQYFSKLGVSERELLVYLNIKNINEINQEQVFELRGVANAIREGSTTIQETFRANVADTQQSKDITDKIRQTAAQKKAPAPTVDKETGEIKSN